MLLVFSAGEIRGAEIFCDPVLQPYLERLHRIREVRIVLNKILINGSIHIVSRNCPLAAQFGAYWDRKERVICIHCSHEMGDGEILGTLLFELENAANDPCFARVDALFLDGKIDGTRYAEFMEFLEYVHSLKAAKIAKEGIEAKILPLDAALPIYPNFCTYLQAQQEGGHFSYYEKVTNESREQKSPANFERLR